MDFTKIFQSNGLKPKNKVHTNFYKCCDLTEKVYLVRGDERSGELYFFILPMEAERGRSGRDLKASSILSRVFSSFLVSTGLERGLLLLSIGPI